MEVTVSENPKKDYMILIYMRGSVTRVNSKENSLYFSSSLKLQALK